MSIHKRGTTKGTNHTKKSNTPTRRRKVVIGALIILGLWLFVGFVFPKVSYLRFRPFGEPYHTTRFEFQYGHETRFVDDPGNHMQFVFGELPDSIEVDNGVRTIIYDEYKAIIKSGRDSIEVDNNTLRHKGYMGIWSKRTHFLVDNDGIVQELQNDRSF